MTILTCLIKQMLLQQLRQSTKALFSLIHLSIFIENHVIYIYKKIYVNTLYNRCEIEKLIYEGLVFSLLYALCNYTSSCQMFLNY